MARYIKLGKEVDENGKEQGRYLLAEMDYDRDDANTPILVYNEEGTTVLREVPLQQYLKFSCNTYWTKGKDDETIELALPVKRWEGPHFKISRKEMAKDREEREKNKKAST